VGSERSPTIMSSNVRLLRHLKAIVALNAEQAHRNFPAFGMSGQQRRRPQVPGLPVGQRSPRVAHGMGAVRRIVESDRGDPAMTPPAETGAQWTIVTRSQDGALAMVCRQRRAKEQRGAPAAANELLMFVNSASHVHSIC